MYKKIIMVFFIVLTSTLSFHCGSSLSLPISANIFPDTKDVELGKQVDEEIRKNSKEYPILEGHQDFRNYIENIGKKILASPEIKKKEIYA
ncbi:MAG: hypothetical protein V1799_06755 [bacterium]